MHGQPGYRDGYWGVSSQKVVCNTECIGTGTSSSCPRDRWQQKRGFDRALADASLRERLLSEVKPSDPAFLLFTLVGPLPHEYR